jgi:SagB-type dehydrogenase family enzyme
MARSTNRDINLALAYHEATKHSYTSVRSISHILDWDNRPIPYKIYPGAGTLALPRELTLSTMPALTALLRIDASPETSLDVEGLTRLLFCSGGLTRRANVDGEDYHFRAAPSAGALYPVELYVVAGEIEGLERGLYHFLAGDLKLHGLRRGDWRPYLARHTLSASIGNARAVLIMTSIFWRSTWKYRARAYRYCFWDTGTIVANLLAAANADRLETAVVTAFEDGPLEALLEVDGDREGIACMVALGRSRSAVGESPIVGPMELESIPLSAKEVVYDDLVRIQQASRLWTPEEVSEVRNTRVEPVPRENSHGTITLEPVDSDSATGLGDTILRRGSTRIFAREAIRAEELGAVLATSKLNANMDFPPLTETYVIVNAVEGVEPGAYYYGHEIRTWLRLKAGNFRREAGHLCLDQPLGADCSALIIYMADLERILRGLGNRAYRDAHLEAGLLGGRAYLAAYSLGLGATGLTFYDDDTTAFLQSRLEKMSPLLMVAVGVPRSRRGET